MAKKASRAEALAGPRRSGAPGTARELLDAAVKQFLPKLATGSTYGKKIDDIAAGKVLLKQDRGTQAAVVHEALERLAVLEKAIKAFQAKHKDARRHEPRGAEWDNLWNPRWVLAEALRGLLRRDLPLGEDAVVRLLRWPLMNAYYINNWQYPVSGIVNAAEKWAATNALGPAVQAALERLAQRLRRQTHDKESCKAAARLEVLVRGGPEVAIEPGEAWSDAALADLGKLKGKHQQAWNALLLHCQAGGQGKPTAAWQQQAEPLIAAVGFDELKEHLLRWFPLVDKPRTQPIGRHHSWAPDRDQLLKAEHVELLRGLVWCCGLREDADLARALARLALSAYRKIPGKGPRLVSLGNACVTALGMMPGQAPIGQLAVLKVKVKFGTAQKEIEKAFNAAAEREGLPREDIEELSVPPYGLEGVGVLRASFGDYRAELTVDGSSATLHWLKEDKPLKSAPAAVKQSHPAELKDLQAAVKAIAAMLPAQRQRLDTLFLARKSWPLGVWRERYLEHPLLGTIARRLIWSFTARGDTTHGAWHGDGLVGVNGKPLNLKGDVAVTLWHPIDRPTDEVLAWRDWLERHEVVQPFKQAHREVYVLTDAERRTGTYSNRFAAHVLRQHQFHALCAARGWKNRLRMMVDDTYPPAHRLLAAWNLRAEYWIEGAGEEYGRDTNDSGAFLYLTTDQVRFYETGAAQRQAHAAGGGYAHAWGGADDPLPLEAVPALVFSEIMRDVDLFVGVASVGNDPGWSDGGPDGRYRDYWQGYSFGELSATAQTRRALLERLIPRLKIADRCTLSDRFLTVRGELRSYKIHLGSGNILMTPNDQYLCIVPKQTTAGHERIFLPFEGDSLLSVILGKAFLLAEDTKITDPTITSQL